jgi:hypothetical protein
MTRRIRQMWRRSFHEKADRNVAQLASGRTRNSDEGAWHRETLRAYKSEPISNYLRTRAPQKSGPNLGI